MFPTFLDTEAGTDSAKLRDEHERAVERRKTIRADVSRAEDAIRRAPQLDAAEYASAIRAGKPDPGPVNRLAAEQAVEDARRRLAGENSAVKAIESDLAQMRAERSVAWQADVVARLADARADAEQAFAAFTEAQSRVDALRSVEAWIATGRASVPQETTSLRNPGGQPLTVPKLVAAVGEAIATEA